MRLEEQRQQVIADIYEAAVNPNGWSTTIDGLRQLLGGAGGVVFLTGADQQIVSWHSIGIEPDGSEYGRRIHAINPRAHWSQNAAPGAVCWDYRFTNDREMDRHEFYDWIGREGDVRYFIGAHYPLDNGMNLFTSIERNARQGHVDTPDIAQFELLVPHVRNAVTFSLQFAQTKRRASLFDLLDRNGAVGLLLLSKDARVLEINPEADRILTLNDGLAVVDGQLKTSKAAETRKLNGLIANAIAAETGDSTVISLVRPSGALPYLLRVLPWPLHLDGTREAIAAAVMINDPGRQGRRLANAELCAGLGLSVREAELALLLGQGKSMAEAASAMRISVNTARVHLAHIFEKTGVSHQADLLRLLWSFPQ